MKKTYQRKDDGAVVEVEATEGNAVLTASNEHEAAMRDFAIVVGLMPTHAKATEVNEKEKKVRMVWEKIGEAVDFNRCAKLGFKEAVVEKASRKRSS